MFVRLQVVVIFGWEHFPFVSACFRVACSAPSSQWKASLDLLRYSSEAEFITCSALASPWPQAVPCWIGQMYIEHLLTVSFWRKKKISSWRSLSLLSIFVQKASSRASCFWPCFPVSLMVSKSIQHNSYSPIPEYTIQISTFTFYWTSETYECYTYTNLLNHNNPVAGTGLLFPLVTQGDWGSELYSDSPVVTQL